VNSAFALLAASVLLAASPAGGDRLSGKDTAHLSHCVVSLIDHVQLPAQLPGVLVEVSAKEGMLVEKDQILGRIDDTEALVRLKSVKAKLAVAREKADDDSEVKAANKVAELYHAEFEESVAINKRSPGTVAETQLRRQRGQWEKGILDAAVAARNLVVAGLEQKVAEVEVEAVETDLQRRTIKSPFGGVVVQLLRQQNEWVQPGDPLLRVVRMDRLRVEGFLEAGEYSPEQVFGARVSVKVKLAGGDQETLTGTVDFVSPLVEASGDYRIFAEIDNRVGRGGYPWLVRPGSDVEMTIQLNKAGAAPVRRPREQ
jgi:multidrug resistance efflux pump